MTRTRQNEPSPRQQEALDWIRSFIHEHCIPPTVREIGEALGIKSSSAFDLLQALERKGFLKRGDLGARSLIVKGERQGSCSCEDIPVVGRIAAGTPLEPIEHDAGTIHVSRQSMRGHSGFALQVVGESMIEDGILDGDFVVIRKQETAEDGDIVVALIDGEATLKRFFQEKHGVRLEPANRRLKPLIVREGDFRIQGVLVGVQRTFAAGRPQIKRSNPCQRFTRPGISSAWRQTRC